MFQPEVLTRARSGGTQGSGDAQDANVLFSKSDNEQGTGWQSKDSSLNAQQPAAQARFQKNFDDSGSQDFGAHIASHLKDDQPKLQFGVNIGLRSPEYLEQMAQNSKHDQPKLQFGVNVGLRSPEILEQMAQNSTDDSARNTRSRSNAQSTDSVASLERGIPVGRPPSIMADKVGDISANDLWQPQGRGGTLGKEELFSLLQVVQQGVDFGIPKDSANTKFVPDKTTGTITLMDKKDGMAILSFGVHRGKLSIQIENAKQTTQTDKEIKKELSNVGVSYATKDDKVHFTHKAKVRENLGMHKRELVFNSTRDIANVKVTERGLEIERKNN